MTRPILIMGKRRYSFQWTSLATPTNDVLRCIALCAAANDDGWQGKGA
jgi:hypothetical protein